MNKRLTLLYIVFALVLLSCGKDTHSITPDGTPFEPPIKIFTELEGIVFDKDGAAIAGALVEVNNETTTSDDNGYYKLETYINSAGENFTITKQGYYDASGMLITSEDHKLKTNVVLIRKEVTLSGQSGVPSYIRIPGLEVDFAANSFIDSHGTAYNGTVEISAEYHDPLDDIFHLTNPGYRKTVIDGQLENLEFFAMINLELQNQAGQEINISQPATVKIQIPQDLLDEAPDEIDMYHRDEETGLWIQETKATKIGENYVAELAHFSGWGCAFWHKKFKVEGWVTRKDKNGEYVPYPYAKLFADPIGSRCEYRKTTASDEGYFVLEIPRRFSDYNLQVLDNCKEVLSNIELSAVVDEDIMQDLVVEQVINLFTVDGNLFCETPSTIVTNGYVRTDFPNNKFHEIIPANDQGYFNFSFYNCMNENVTLTGVDPVNFKKSSPKVVEEDSSLSLNVCEDDLKGFVRFESDQYGVHEFAGAFYTNRIWTYENKDYHWFTILATDYYANIPGADGEYAEYQIVVTSRESVDGIAPIPQNPQGPFNAISSSDNIPFEYSIAVIPANMTIVEWDEPDGKLVLEVRNEGPGQKSLWRKVNGEQTYLDNGIMTIEAYKE